MCPKRSRDPEDDFHARLDYEGRRLAKEHKSLLSAAAFEHERVREQAQLVQERWRVQMELDRQMRENAARQALQEESEELVKRQIARQHEDIEESQRLQRLRREAAEAQERAAQLRAERAKTPPPAHGDAQPASQEAPPLQKYEKPPARHPTAPSQQPTPESEASATISTATSAQYLKTASGPSAVAKSKHQRYLDVHTRLKQLRRSVSTLSDAQLKKRAGEFRREIKKSVGQLTINMAANTAPYNKIRSTLAEAAKLSQPQINIREYIVEDLPPELASAPAAAGLVQTYLLNIFSKAVVSQFVNEAGVAPKAAEPIGTVAIRIFAANEFKWQGVSLIDILLSKLHAVCPVLFGMYKRGPSARKQKQGEALTGLGSGYAALSLRDFGKSTIVNPFPPSNYWRAIARVVNTPSADVTQEHFIVLKAMIENHAGKFIKFYGQPAIAALRKAVVEFPAQSAKSVASSSLSTLQVTLRRDIHLTL